MGIDDGEKIEKVVDILIKYKTGKSYINFKPFILGVCHFIIREPSNVYVPPPSLTCIRLSSYLSCI